MTILSKLQLWNYMLQDMKEPVSYLPQAILIGLSAAAAGLFSSICRKQDKKRAVTGPQQECRKTCLSHFYPVLISRLPDSITSGGIFLASARLQNLR